MNNRHIVIAVIGALVIAGGFFYAGMQYQKGSSLARGQFTNGQFPQGANFRNAGAGGEQRAGGGFATGEILSKDEQSVTIKMQDGSTKIVLVSDSTNIMKSIEGSQGDLSVGESVSVVGSANSDGSVSAQTIQLGTFGRPQIQN